jgi:uncharacterized protein (TIGR02466 family)
VNESIDGRGTRAELLFATPLFSEKWPDADELNAYLRELILARERADARPREGYSNVGGWHSAIDLQESLDGALLTVLQRARDLAASATESLLEPGERSRRIRYVVSAWANVSRAGDYNVPHVHTSTWSAVYYVAVPPCCAEGSAEGALELIDPRSGTAMIDMPGRFFATRRTIVPEAGMIVLFPASVMHFVHPFRGAGERISIACDLTADAL